MSSLADLEDEIETIPAGGGNYGSSLKELPDGEYEFGIASAVSKKIESTGSELVEFKLELLTSGRTQGRKYQHSYWLTNKDDGGLNAVSVGILKKDLTTLGFDVENWTKANGRPFFSELKKAVKILNGGGFAFSGKKVTKSGHANLYVNTRSETDGKPAKFDAAAMDKLGKANELGGSDAAAEY